ncbi:DUF5777 family beta-barrel protein [Polaribacter tangerinus]|uniref:DUF5777 family beta-barrel protein n=1 Tax=Polaribacter tangerinus TaxID=1920034 RepID=UPI000B4AD774|nr:DUF5777 family beta-barrel protein [Polaribacter tangerinus]
MNKKNLFLTIAVFSVFILKAQDKLLDELNEFSNKEVVFELPAFKAMKIGNLQSTKIAEKGDLYLYVSHRFGSVKDGFETLFGLDNANTNIQLLYSFWDGVQFSVSRESLRQTYASAVKIRLIKQSTKFPVNLAFYGTANINAELNEDIFPNLKFGDRMSYAAQILASKRVTDNLSLLIAPSYIRQNLQDLNLVGARNHNQFAMGLGGRYKLSKRVSMNMDYAYNFNRDENSIYKNPLTIGMDLETGGHVFQLLFSNAQSTNEPGFLSQAEGDWNNGVIFFGFNIVRVF